MKMDDNPGITLFQNADFGKRNFNTPEPEELEAAEDEKRRNEELKEMMQGAFDDLEEDTNIYNSSYFTPVNGVGRVHDIQYSKNRSKNPSSMSKSQASQSAENNFEQLQVLYQIRLREIEKLHTEIKDLREESSTEKKQLTEKLTAIQSEKEKAFSYNNELEKALVEAKTRISTYEKDAHEIRKQLEESNNLKHKAQHDLELSKLTIRELEQRLILAENNNFKNEEKNFNELLKDITSKHKREVIELQTKNNNFQHKFAQKEKDCTKLQHQLADLQRTHDAMLIKKSEIINKLTANLEESQSQCQKLISGNAGLDSKKLCSQLKMQKTEIDRLQNELDSVLKENKILTEQAESLKSERKNISNTKEHAEELLKIQLKVKELEQANAILLKEVTKRKDNSIHEEKDTSQKNNFFNDKVTVNEMREKICKLETELEESLSECDTVKKLYIDVCTIKDKLQTQNNIIEKELSELNREKEELNGKIKLLCSEKEKLIKTHESMKNKLSQLEEELANMNRNRDIDMKEYEQMHLKELETFKNSVRIQLTKLEMSYQEKMNKLQIECTKTLAEEDAKHKEKIIEAEGLIKEEALKVCNEEINALTEKFKTQYSNLLESNAMLEHQMKEQLKNYDTLKKDFDNLKLTNADKKRDSEVKRLKIELRSIETKYDVETMEWSQKLEQSEKRYVKLFNDFQEVYLKYKKARKTATSLKETLDERNALLKQHNKLYLQTINEIQSHINDVLVVQSNEIEEPAKENLFENCDLVPSSKEFDTVMDDINKKLQILKTKQSQDKKRRS